MLIVVLTLSNCSKKEEIKPIVYGEETPLFMFLSRMPGIYLYENAV